MNGDFNLPQGLNQRDIDRETSPECDVDYCEGCGKQHALTDGICTKCAADEDDEREEEHGTDIEP